MKILMLSSYLPYPLHSGGQVRLYNLIRELSDQHEITLICEKRPHQTIKDIAEVEKICKKVITVDRRKQWSLQNILQSGTSSHSFLVTGHTLKEMQGKIREEMNTTAFDLIHVETFYVMQNLPETTIPVVLAEHNIEYKVYDLFLKRIPFVLRTLLKIDVAKIKKEEELFWGKTTKLVAVSEEDKKVMEAKGLRPTVVSNGVNIDKFSFVGKKDNVDKKLLFIGDFNWIQNRDAATWIITDIWPLVSSQLKAKLWIVGREIPESIRNLSKDSNVIFDTESSAWPTEKIFQEADALLAPIRVGGGTSYKILESSACGTPVVTTPMSAQAVNARDGEEIMIGKTAEELAQKTVSLLQNKNLYDKVRKGGRTLIEKKYSWKAIAKVLDGVYKSTK